MSGRKPSGYVWLKVRSLTRPPRGRPREIKAIPDLLQPLDIAGAIISINAIGCQKDITRQIVKQQANYIIGLKANQDGLYEQVADWFERIKPTLEADRGSCCKWAKNYASKREL